MATDTTPRPALSDEELQKLLELIKGADSVELKLTVPEENQRSTVRALGLDPLQAEIRQVFFLDTPELALDKQGLVVRARRSQRKGDDTVVKLRPVVPSELPKGIRRSPSFGVEVDASPGGFVCSGSMKGTPTTGHVQEAVHGQAGAAQALLEGAAGALRRARARRDRARRPLDPRPALRPQAEVLARGLRPQAGGRDVALSGWSRILELSTKCVPARGVPGRRRDARVPRLEGRRPRHRAADEDADGARDTSRRTSKPPARKSAVTSRRARRRRLPARAAARSAGMRGAGRRGRRRATPPAGTSSPARAGSAARTRRPR